MLFLKAAVRSKFYAWEIAQNHHLFVFAFLFLPCIAVCDSFSLFSSRNSSFIQSPLHFSSLTSTPTLTGLVSHEQTLHLPQDQSSLATTVNDGYISKFRVSTGDDETRIRTTEVLSSSSLKLDVQIVESTQRSHSVGKAVQSENHNAESTKNEDPYQQSVQLTDGLTTGIVVQTSSVQHNTRILTTFDKSQTIKTLVLLPHVRFSAGSSTESNTAISVKKTSDVALSPYLVSQNVAVTRTTDSSLLLPYKKFTGPVSSLMSSLRATNYVLNTYELSPGEGRSKSTFLSHYSTGVATKSQGLSTSKVQLSPRVSSTFSSSSSALISSSLTSSTIVQASSIFTSSFTTWSPYLTSSNVARASTPFVSSSASPLDDKSAPPTQHVLFTKAATASSFAHITSVQPLMSSSVSVQGKAVLTCKVNNAICVCFNCEEGRRNGKMCCVDKIDRKTIQHGVILNVVNITVSEFYQKAKVFSRIAAGVVWDSCRENATLCVTGNTFSDIAGERKKRSLQEHIFKKHLSSDLERIRTKREALRSDINPFKINISHVDVIIYSISSKAGHPPRVQTAFYVTMTSINNGTNQTVVLDGKGLLQLLRDKKRTLENRLNITIDSFTASQKRTEPHTTASHQKTLVPNPSPGSQNMQTPVSTSVGRYL